MTGAPAPASPSAPVSAPTSPPVDDGDWDGVTGWIRAGHGLHRLERLLAAADRLRSTRPNPHDPLDETCRRLGLTVQRVDLPPNVSGLCGETERGPRIVVVNRNDDRRRQNFTVGHELGHLLLGSHAELGQLAETWCDRFAARLLCDPRDLTAAIGDPHRLRPDTVRDAAARLGLSLSATVVALRTIPLPASTAVMLIRRYRHRIAAADAPRIAVSASPSMFIPADRRLRRIGMTNLADYVDLVHTRGVRPDTVNTLDKADEPPADRRVGRDRIEAVRAVSDGTHRPARGTATWSAIAGGRHDIRYVLAVATFSLDVDPTRTPRRLPATPRRPVHDQAQLTLD